MNITLFNKKYWVRRFKEPQNIRGYITAAVSYTHLTLPTTSRGQRQMCIRDSLEGHGTDVLIPASEATGIKGDLLYYMGDWYECTAAQPWDHTVLSHLNYQFCLVPTDGARASDIEDPPQDDPATAGKTQQEIPPITNFPIASADTVGVVRIKDDSGLVIDEEGFLSLAKPTDGGDTP